MAQPQPVPNPFDLEHFVECCENANPNPYTLSINNGASNVLTDELRKLRMLTAIQGGNAERTRRLYAHYRQWAQANPRHYHPYPMFRFPAQFLFRRDMWLHHSGIFRFLHQPTPKLIMVFLMTYLVHYLSYKLFVIDLEFAGYKIPSCIFVPTQRHCYPLKQLQDYTFSGIDDFGKMAFTLGMNGLYNKLIPYPQAQ